jgi:hypothetical protein
MVKKNNLLRADCPTPESNTDRVIHEQHCRNLKRIQETVRLYIDRVGKEKILVPLLSKSLGRPESRIISCFI